MADSSTFGVRCRSSRPSGLLAPAVAAAGAARLTGDRGDLAGLHQPLEVAQVLADLPAGGVARHRRDPVAKAPARRQVVEVDVDLGAAIAERTRETHLSAGCDVGARQRAPRDQRARL